LKELNFERQEIYPWGEKRDKMRDLEKRIMNGFFIKD